MNASFQALLLLIHFFLLDQTLFKFEPSFFYRTPLLAIGVLTSSQGVGDSDTSRVVARVGGGDVIEGVAEGVVWGVDSSA